MAKIRQKSSLSKRDEPMKDKGKPKQGTNNNLVDGQYSIQDLVDLDQLRAIFEKFTESTGFTIGFLDHPGLNILIATGWKDICTKFHRICPTSVKNCMKSNKNLLEQLKEPGQLVIEECDNGLVDCATPIIIKGKHIASLATGQLLLKKPDIERFKRQARECQFDEKKYLKALKEIPVVSEEKLKSITSFLGDLSTIISDMGYTNLTLKYEAVLLDKEITERKKAEDELNRKVEFEKLIMKISTQFIHLQSDMIDAEINNALQIIGTFANVDRSYIFLFSKEGQFMDNLYEWSAEGIEPQIDNLQGLSAENLKWWVDKLDRFENIHIPRVAELPSEASAEKEILQAQDIQSLIIVPMIFSGCLIGFLGFDSVRTEKTWDEEDITLLRIVGEIITNALMHKQAEKSLQKTKEKYLDLFENANDMIFTSDLNGNFTSVNKTACTILGYNREEMIGKNIRDILTPESFKTAYEFLQKAVMLKSDLTELQPWALEVVRKAGYKLSVEVKTRLIWENDQIIGVHGIARDVTDRKRIEENLRESERRYKELANLLPQIVFEIDNNGKFTFVNRNAFDFYGYTEDDFLKGAYALDMFIPEDRERVQKNIQKRLRGEKLGGVEYTALRKDGTNIPVLIFASPIMRNNIPIGLRGIVIDITERKQTEKALKLNESRMATLLELSRMTNQPDQELTDFALEKAIELTQSTIGYLAFMNEDESVLTMYSWSRQAMQECMITEKPLEYPVKNTGLWGEAVRQRKPVITNEYQALNPLKKGYPEGHVHVNRHMNIPLLDGKKIVLVAGVGNKEGAYEESDIQQLTILMDGMWKIIKQNRADKALRESEEKYHSVMDDAGDMILLADLNGKILEGNKKAREILGYTKEELAAMHYSMIHPPEVLEQTSAAFDEIILTGHVDFRDGLILRKDGRTVPVDIKGSLIAYSDSLMVQWIYSDMTERKRMETDLRESEQFVRAVIDLVPHFIFVKDEQSRFLLANNAVAEAYGTTTHDIVGKSDSDFSATPEEAEHFHKDDMAVMLGGTPKIIPEETITDSEGNRRYLRTIKIPFRFGAEGIPCILGVAVDITEHKKAEEALHISEEKYRLVVDNASDAIFIAQDELLKFPNHQISLLTGYTHEELIRMPFKNFIHPEDRSMVLERYRRRLRGEDVPSVYSFRIINKTREIIWVEISAVLLTWEGRPATLNFLRDITVQKKLEEQLLQSQKMEAVGQLAGGVAHDFNNLLTAIIGYGHLIKDQASKDELISAYVSQVLNAAERAAVLTNDLLTFGRKKIVNLQAVDLNTIIKNVESLLLRVIGEDIEFSADPTDTDLTILADSSQIDQILMNLATNAQDAMPKGGSLLIKTGRVEINGDYVRVHGYGKSGTYALLSVEDTGIGIDEKIRDKIFEPFFTTKEVGKGTGLGLAMVYGIVKQHNGYINVYSELGKGTTFKILFPLISSKASSLKVESLQKAKGGIETILIGEDDQQVRNLLKEVLSHAGYNIIEAIDGEDAVKVFHENGDKIDLLIFDAIMPKKNGKEAYEEIRKVEPDIKIIFVSGYSLDIMHKKGILEAGLHFISKPVSPDELLIKVRDILDNSTRSAI
ncbi:MAG: PAS domain S-box protein [Nitrospira sp.]|nr:PAS domain S-box protein [Nitrospira sp.]